MLTVPVLVNWAPLLCTVAEPAFLLKVPALFQCLRVELTEYSTGSSALLPSLTMPPARLVNVVG